MGDYYRTKSQFPIKKSLFNTSLDEYVKHFTNYISIMHIDLYVMKDILFTIKSRGEKSDFIRYLKQKNSNITNTRNKYFQYYLANKLSF